MSMLGLVSRRDAEKLINAKKIRINGINEASLDLKKIVEALSK